MARSSLPWLLLALAPMALGQPAISAVLNGASYSALLSPGCWAAIFGANMATATAGASAVPLPRTLGNVSVTVDGIPAPLLYVSPTQINFLIPYEVTLPIRFGMPSQVVVSSQGSASLPYAIQLSRNAPAIFTRNANGTGRALLFDPGFRPVETVAPQDTVIFYAAGLGPTDPPATSDSGATASGPPLLVADNVDVFIGERKLSREQILFVGLAPGFPGVYQVNVRVPPGLATDRLYLRVRGWQSNLTDVGIPAGNNVTNVTGAITLLYPPAQPNAPAYPIGRPIPECFSVALEAAAFTVDFGILNSARPFTVAAVGDTSAAIFEFDPVMGTWQSSITEPTPATRAGDFSAGLPDIVVLDCLTLRAGAWEDPLPANVLPAARIDPVLFKALFLLPLPSGTGDSPLMGLLSQSGAAPAGSGFSIAFPREIRFAGWLHLPLGPFATRTSTFKLYVDGRLITSQDAVYQVQRR